MPFGIHSLQVTHVVVTFTGALDEQSAAARPAGRRRRRHLFGSFGKSIHGRYAQSQVASVLRNFFLFYFDSLIVICDHDGQEKKFRGKNDDNTQSLYTTARSATATIIANDAHALQTTHGR